MWCPIRVTAALEGRPGILEPPRVDVHKSRVLVKFDPKLIAPAEIAAAIAEHEAYTCPEPGIVTSVGEP